LEQRVEEAIASRPRVALLLRDIDNFKEINDTFGRLGDALLRQVGPRLRDQLEPGDVIGRLGGDEFGILLPGADLDRAIKVAHALLRVERPFLAAGHALDLMASIGIAVCPEHGASSESLLQRAEVAMYAAKRSGNSYSVYREQDDPYDAADSFSGGTFAGLSSSVSSCSFTNRRLPSRLVKLPASRPWPVGVTPTEAGSHRECLSRSLSGWD
jgi:diguanylate cyclase (GGDEF)-like protein